MIDVSAACCIRMRRANDLASRKPLAQRTTDGLCAAESPTLRGASNCSLDRYLVYGRPDGYVQSL